MSLFNAIGIAGTGVTVYRKWLDAVSDNLSNINDAAPTSGEAFRAKYVIAQEASDGHGAQVGGIVEGSGVGRLVYEPTHPLALTPLSRGQRRPHRLRARPRHLLSALRVFSRSDQRVPDAAQRPALHGRALPFRAAHFGQVDLP